MTEIKTCASCRWCKLVDLKRGECRYYPPKLSLDSTGASTAIFPVVKTNAYWCSFYIPKNLEFSEITSSDEKISKK